MYIQKEQHLTDSILRRFVLNARNLSPIFKMESQQVPAKT